MPLRTLDPLEAFRNTVSALQQATQTNHFLPATDYERPQGGQASYTHRTSIIRPTLSDFIADVELAARRCLNAGELGFFGSLYASCKVVVTERARDTEDTSLDDLLQTRPEREWPAVRSLDNKIREKLGKHFLDCEIYPFSVYMEAKDVSGRKYRRKPKGNVILFPNRDSSPVERRKIVCVSAADVKNGVRSAA